MKIAIRTSFEYVTNSGEYVARIRVYLPAIAGTGELHKNLRSPSVFCGDRLGSNWGFSSNSPMTEGESCRFEDVILSDDVLTELKKTVEAHKSELIRQISVIYSVNVSSLLETPADTLETFDIS